MNEQEEAGAAPGSLPQFDLENQNLIFGAGGELFAFEIRHILEVVEEADLIDVPRAPDFIAGVINHLGRVMTAIDLAGFFGFGAGGAKGRYVILLDHEQVQMGLLADRVEGIEYIPDDLPAGEPGAGDKQRVAAFVDGVVSHGGRLVNRLKAPELLAGIEGYF